MRSARLALLFLLWPAAASASSYVVAKDRAGAVRRYRLGAPLGQPGAGGAVYRASDETTGKQVAIKVPHDGSLHKRLMFREASLLRRLDGSARFPELFGVGHLEGEPNRPAMVQ